MVSPPLRVHALVDSLGAGGAELLLAEFARVAPDAGIELSVGALRGQADSPAALRLHRAGIEPVIVPVKSLLGRRDVRAVREHLDAVAPDLLHTHLGYADTLGGLAARGLGLPVVSTIHADWWGGDRRERARQRIMALARRRCAHRVIAVSQAARRAYLEAGRDRPERVAVVHNGITASAAPGSGAAVRRELGLGEGDMVVSMISRLGHEKGHDVALEAVAALHRELPGLRLLIVGDGELREEIERRAAPLGEAVVVAGHRDDVMEILDATDVLLQPSRFEAFPTTLLEAMVAGTPIVATATGGIPEMVEDGSSALLVDAPPAADAVGAALARVLGDAELSSQLAANARARFASEFSARSWAEGTRAVYDQVLAEITPPSRS